MTSPRKSIDAPGARAVGNAMRLRSGAIAVGILLLGGCGGDETESTALDGGAGLGGSDAGAVSPTAGADGAAPGCGVAEPEPNDTRDKATPYVAGMKVVACVGAEDDVDFYEFTAPITDPAGGYYAIAVDDVGAGYADLQIYSASDNGSIDHEYSTDAGGSVRAYFAAASGQRYRIAVTNFAGFEKPFRYTLTATYNKVTDPFEPNDTRASATPITLGTPVTATLFAGHQSSMIDGREFDDFYKVEVAAGTVTAKVADVPTDTYPDLVLLDADGAELEHAYSTTMGANATVTMKAVTAGTVYLHVGVFSSPPPSAGKGVMLPDHFSHSYKLTVQQP